MQRLAVILGLFATLGICATTAVAAPSDPGSVSFVVTDAKGNAVSGAEVGIWNDDDVIDAVTDAGGTALLLDVPQGEWTAWATAEGFTGQERDVAVAPDSVTPVQIVLAPGIPFAGRVTNAAGEPIPEASVDALAGGSFEGYGEVLDRPPFDRVVAGDDGAFRIRGIPAGAVSTLHVQADGYRDARVAVRAQGDGVRPSPLVIVLLRGATLSGTVFDPDGKPVAGATVFVVPADAPELVANPHVHTWNTKGGSGAALTAETESDGTFEVPGIAQDVAVIALAEGDGFARSKPSNPLTPTAEKPAVSVDLHLRKPTTLELGVFPRRGVVKTAPDEPGLFRLAGLTPGEIEYAIKAEGLLPHEGKVTLADGETKRVAVVLSAGVAIAGTVRDPDGKPVKDVLVMLTREETTPDGGWRSFESGRTKTDAEGRFDLRGLAHGKHKLAARIRDTYDIGDEIEVEAPNPSLDVTVRPVGTLRVRFSSPNGGPSIPDAAFVWRWDDGGGGMGSDESITDGVMILRGFQGDALKLEARFEDFVPWREDVTVDWGEDADLGTVTLDPGVALRGKVVDPEGKGVVGALVAWGKNIREAVSSADGTFTLPHLPAGKTEIVVEAEGFLEQAAPIEVATGAKPVSVTLLRGAFVHGRLADADGKPLGAHWIQFRRPPKGQSDEKGAFLDETGTDDDGSFEIRIPSGPFRVLFITKEKVHVLATLDLAEGADEEVALTLR